MLKFSSQTDGQIILLERRRVWSPEQKPSFGGTENIWLWMFGPYLIEKRADRAFSGVWLATEGEGMILAVIVLSEWTSAEWSVGQFNMEKYQSCACFQSSAHFFFPHNDIVEAFIFSLFKPGLLIVSYYYRDCNFWHLGKSHLNEGSSNFQVWSYSV